VTGRESGHGRTTVNRIAPNNITRIIEQAEWGPSPACYLLIDAKRAGRCAGHAPLTILVLSSAVSGRNRQNLRDLPRFIHIKQHLTIDIDLDVRRASVVWGRALRRSERDQFFVGKAAGSLLHCYFLKRDHSLSRSWILTPSTSPVQYPNSDRR
jgi:hypothetical protein